MSEFEIDTDEGGAYIWRLKADNGEIVARSSEGYVRRCDCENGLQNFRGAFTEEKIRQHDVRVYESADGWRWRYVHQNGNIIAVGEAYHDADAAEKGLATALFHAARSTTGVTDLTGN